MVLEKSFGGTLNDSLNHMVLLPFTPASPEGQILTESGASPQILIYNYNETATDALGRVLPTSEETGLPRKGKYVGLFYFLWTGINGSVTSNIDVTKAYACAPADPLLGKHGEFCWWTEPETGYHRASDVWQIKRDMYYFAMAGIDFLYLDFTNGRIYEDTLRILLDVCLELRANGQMTPYIVPFAHGTLNDNRGTRKGDVGDLYRIFYSNKKYNDLWFHWEGKPLVLICAGTDVLLEDAYLDDSKTKTYSDYFTFRIGWSSLKWPGKELGYKQWNDNCVVNYGYRYGYTEDPSKAECVGIGCAGFANAGSGRSGEYSQRQYLDKFLVTTTMGDGITLENAYREVVSRNPEVQVLLLSRWNEGVAQNLNVHDFGFVDQFNAEFSRDIEPIKGNYTDNYFYQMCSIIRRFKGILPADEPTGKKTIRIDGDFSDWYEIKPVFTDFWGDTSERNDYDVTGNIHYTNVTGRNDIVESRMTADHGMIYVYVRTAKPITSYKGANNWMLLFMDTDNNKSTGWEGYDFVVNYHVIDDTTTTLCVYKDNIWQEIGSLKYQVNSTEMMVAIPRSLIGLTEECFTLNFHWIDNVTNVYELESWFTTGDSAPERRNNYTISMTIPYDSTKETMLTPRVENKVSCMPAVPMSSWTKEKMQTGLGVTVYHIDADYGKMPDFYHIAGNKIQYMRVNGIGAGIEMNMLNIALEYHGYINIADDDEYSFHVVCNAGMRLYVDDRMMMETPYQQENDTIENCKKIRLAKGYHTFKVEYANWGNRPPLLSLQGKWEFWTTSEVFSADIETEL